MRYYAVQRGGLTNMFNVKMVIQLSGLTREIIMDIMSNYNKYADQWLTKR